MYLARLTIKAALLFFSLTQVSTLASEEQCVDGTCADPQAEPLDPSKLHWETPPLAPGEIKKLRIKETGEAPVKYGHRVGLPQNLTKSVLAYAERLGITDELKSRVVDGNILDFETDLVVPMKEGTKWWLRRFPSFFHNDLHFMTPADDDTTLSLLRALGEGGFDAVLEGIGNYFGLDGLQCFYVSFLAVTHCNGTMMHFDSYSTKGKSFNVIFPLIQVEDSPPELNIQADDDEDFVVPYKYEHDAAPILGDDAMHATAFADYRGTGKYRLVMTVYMAADVTEKTVRRFVKNRETDTDQPPYPQIGWREQFLKRSGADWKRGDPTKHLPRADQTSLF